jgi:glucosamine--fructose-6-phosphate aminotransferase (isomerizing)
MCGIVCYIGDRQAQNILLNGLKRLEYRGYDSSGVAMVTEGNRSMCLRKSPGKIKALEGILKKKPVRGCIGIAHTRWATHGAPNQVNAHPHQDCSGEIAVVHNGIIENYETLRQQLAREGHVFKSQTDTEVIAHLVEKFYDGVTLEQAVRKALGLVVGSFAIGVISCREPQKLVGARMGSPLIVGVGQGEYFLASDVSALLDSTKDVIYLEEKEMAVLTAAGANLSQLDGTPVRRKHVRISWDVTQAQKQGYRHFMLKEINEQPGILENLMKLRTRSGKHAIVFDELSMSQESLASIRQIAIVACGTAYHAGLVGKYIIERLCKIPVSVDVSSEFRYRDLLIDAQTLVIAISQSGETADTLAGLREAKKHGCAVLAICNVLGSTIAREATGVIYTHAGPEIGVASTKAYTAQLVALYQLALYLGSLKGSISLQKAGEYLDEMRKIPAFQAQILGRQKEIARLAKKHSHFGSFLYLGRNINFPSALEGALKLKEISYIPAEGYAAGEMKHGPIALIDEYRAVVCIAPASVIHEKMVSNIQEILSRKGKVMVIATEGDTGAGNLCKEVMYLPRTSELFSPLLVAIPLQLLAYHIAVIRGADVDQPRNLAKSVTVE